jgi:hypothetical protein
VRHVTGVTGKWRSFGKWCKTSCNELRQETKLAVASRNRKMINKELENKFDTKH